MKTLPTIVSTSLTHEPQDACNGQHCWSHDVDEPIQDGEKVYISCFECGHVYRTKGELRRRYLAVEKQMMRDSFDRYGFWNGVCDLMFWLVDVLTKRASRINFCQHCTHDF
jgi:hypothetical protein